MATRPKSTDPKSRFLKPARLKPGDRVGLVCPASRPESPSVVARGMRVVEEMGLVPVVGKHVMRTHGSMAGTDAERVHDFNSFLSDDSIAALFCLTGGYGSLHVIPHVDFDALRAKPKVLLGCDDNCSLLLAVHARLNLVVFHGPNLDQITDKYSFDRLKAVLMETSPAPPVSGLDTAGDSFPARMTYAPVSGRVSGNLLGGNLTAMVSLFGTPYQPRLKDSLLFMEDKNERNDILDRWFTTLYVSGELEQAAGVVFGSFHGCGQKGNYNVLSIEELFADRLKELTKPSCFGLPFGQTDKTATLPVGVLASADMDKGVITFEESALS